MESGIDLTIRLDDDQEPRHFLKFIFSAVIDKAAKRAVVEVSVRGNKFVVQGLISNAHKSV